MIHFETKKYKIHLTNNNLVNNRITINKRINSNNNTINNIKSAIRTVKIQNISIDNRHKVIIYNLDDMYLDS